MLFDGLGNHAPATIESLGDDEAICVSEPRRATEESLPAVTLLLGLPKGAKVDECVRMATELGVQDIALVVTEHAVPRWDASRSPSRLQRLSRIAGEAARQSERTDIPTVHPPRALAEWLPQVPATALRIGFYARGTSRLAPLQVEPAEVWCAIGPEGGFSDAEIHALSDGGFDLITLGEQVLRVQTAVPAALALINDRLASCRQRR